MSNTNNDQTKKVGLQLPDFNPKAGFLETVGQTAKLIALNAKGGLHLTSCATLTAIDVAMDVLPDTADNVKRTCKAANISWRSGIDTLMIGAVRAEIEVFKMAQEINPSITKNDLDDPDAFREKMFEGLKNQQEKEKNNNNPVEQVQVENNEGEKPVK